MNRIEESSRLTPKPAESRLSDLFAETTSYASKGNAARFYAEMMIDLFLSTRLKKELGTTPLQKLNLGEQIKKIKDYTDTAIIDALLRIKDFGDRASHYSPGVSLTKAEADKAVEDAVELIVLILTDELIETPLNAFQGRATLFSTIFPKTRAQILANLLKQSPPPDHAYYLFLVSRYGGALTKSGRYKAARRYLDDLLKKGRIDAEFHNEEVEGLSLLAKSIAYPGQPIAQQMADVARNFMEVRQAFDGGGVKGNEKLISILEILVNDVVPSAFNHHVAQLRLF